MIITFYHLDEEITIFAFINYTHIASNSLVIHLSYTYFITVLEDITGPKLTNTCKLHTKFD